MSILKPVSIEQRKPRASACATTAPRFNDGRLTVEQKHADALQEGRSTSEKHASPNLLFLAGRWVRSKLANALLPAGLVLGISGGCTFDSSGFPIKPSDAAVDVRPLDDGSFDGDADSTVEDEICNDGIDNDQDGDIDCDDSDCLGDPSCGEICGDGLDNDGDGDTDCEDSECFGPACPEVCGDGLDNDGDGATDCDDDDCYGSTCPEVCGDGEDNDGDGSTDCNDDDCYGPACAEVCGDGNDNDGDGATDCNDDDCFGDVTCPVEVCENEGDENADGVADCLAPECDGQQSPGPAGADCELGTEITCDDGYDNDADGLTDCDDPDCFSASCPEICDDGLDNDADGLTDCADDDDCSLYDNGDIKCAYGDANEVNCTDGVDNNGTGGTDCADAACAITAACGAAVEDCTNDVSDNGNSWTDCEDATCSLEDICIENTVFDCTSVPEGSNCPTGMPAPNHSGMCGEDVGLGRVCQPPPGAY